jgi:hypothetical protein
VSRTRSADDDTRGSHLREVESPPPGDRPGKRRMTHNGRLPASAPASGRPEDPWPHRSRRAFRVAPRPGRRVTLPTSATAGLDHSPARPLPGSTTPGLDHSRARRREPAYRASSNGAGLRRHAAPSEPGSRVASPSRRCTGPPSGDDIGSSPRSFARSAGAAGPSWQDVLVIPPVTPRPPGPSHVALAAHARSARARSDPRAEAR